MGRSGSRTPCGIVGGGVRRTAGGSKAAPEAAQGAGDTESDGAVQWSVGAEGECPPPPLHSPSNGQPDSVVWGSFLIILFLFYLFIFDYFSKNNQIRMIHPST